VAQEVSYSRTMRIEIPIGIHIWATHMRDRLINCLLGRGSSSPCGWRKILGAIELQIDIFVMKPPPT
jgi:hypothetical protein